MYSSQKRANIALRKRGLLAWHPFNWKQYEHEVVNRLTAVIKKIFRCIQSREPTAPCKYACYLIWDFHCIHFDPGIEYYLWRCYWWCVDAKCVDWLTSRTFRSAINAGQSKCGIIIEIDWYRTFFVVYPGSRYTCISRREITNEKWSFKSLM